ncbi:helix-turn-helix domain-containing protein [Celerinatantimonas sp. YJH-8]|uniref:AraC family transcriptional regulator n=1 Tax=Celerinatantimonas sp. YJH-8 TaxID=3228714 RepID=UPI0038C15DB7
MTNIYLDIPIDIENGGLFISNGTGRHPRRVIHSFELILVYSGSLTINEESSTYPLGPGDYLLLYPHQEHFGVDDYPEDLKFYWVHFNLSRFSKTSGSQDFMPLPKNGHIADPNKLYSLFNLLLHEQTQGQHKNTLNILLLLIIEMIGEPLSQTSMTITEKTPDLAYRAQSLIRQHYLSAITPSFIARQLQCNVDYLGRIFKRTFQHTLTEAIHEQKIQIAQQMLTETNYPIQSIARGVGYTDPGYFRRIFLKQVKLTPSAYRKLYGIRLVNSR